MISIEPTIRAVGSAQEKGRALERSVGAVWSQLGYRKLKFNIHATGEEIDVEGTHVVSGEILKGQCKAHSAKIDAGPLRQFFGDVEKERGRSDRLTGIFVSLSGFSGTAERWHDELSEKQRGYFKIFKGTDFLTQLEEARLILTLEAFTPRVSALTKLELTHIELLLSERGPFWRITLGDDNKAAAYHGFLTALGAAPRREDVEYLETRITNTHATPRISFAGRESLVRLLLRDSECAVKDIPSKASENPEDIEAAIGSLVAEGLLKHSADLISLRQELDAVIAIGRLCLGTEMQLEFMKSSFYRDCLPTILLPFVEAKYAMSFKAGEADVLVKILSVSPLALKRVLAGDAELFRNTESEIARLRLDDKQSARHRRGSRVMLFDRLIHDLMSDHIDNNVTPLFAHHEIVVTKTAIELKLGKRRESFLIVNSSWFAQIATAGDAIKAGQFVSVDGPGPLLEGGDAKMAINEWSSAIESYDFILAHWPDSEAVGAASNNKAVCLLALGRFDEAVNLLEPLVVNQELRQYALPNLGRCYARMGLKEKAREIVTQLNNELSNTSSVVSLRDEIENLLSSS